MHSPTLNIYPGGETLLKIQYSFLYCGTCIWYGKILQTDATSFTMYTTHTRTSGHKNIYIVRTHRKAISFSCFSCECAALWLFFRCALRLEVLPFFALWQILQNTPPSSGWSSYTIHSSLQVLVLVHLLHRKSLLDQSPSSNQIIAWVSLHTDQLYSKQKSRHWVNVLIYTCNVFIIHKVSDCLYACTYYVYTDIHTC